MDKYLSERAVNAAPYTAGEQPADRQYIKLNTNENAYPPSPKTRKAIRDAVAGLERYPDPSAVRLRAAIAGHHGLTPQNVFVGNGSDEVLALAFMAFFNAGQTLVTPKVGYSFYPVYARLFGVSLIRADMLDGLRVDVGALLASRAPVILANPNAPTSIALTLSDLRRIADALLGRGQLFLVDEAYAGFGAESAVDLLNTHENLLVVRTFSKGYSLAGLRVGYALGHPRLIDALEKIKDSFNSYPVDRLAQAGAAAAITDDAYYAGKRARIARTRDSFLRRVRALGFEGPDSGANFVYIKRPGFDGAHLKAALMDKGILVRHFGGDLCDYLRVSIGTPGDMNAVVGALDEITRAPGRHYPA